MQFRRACPVRYGHASTQPNTTTRKERDPSMYAYIGTIDNFTILPSPVLDESAPQGYRIEQRLQVTIKAASNEQTQTVEFRLGDESASPSEEQLTKWLESGELVQAFCTGLSARPF